MECQDDHDLWGLDYDREQGSWHSSGVTEWRGTVASVSQKHKSCSDTWELFDRQQIRSIAVYYMPDTSVDFLK